MKLVIIKSGSTYPILKKKHGDFDALILKRLEEKNLDFQVISIQNQPELPNPKNIDAVIISGAHENVTDQTAWMKYLIEWILQLKQHKIPTLGICFGHQILGKALGGKIGYHPQGGEFGIVEVTNYASKSATKSLIDSPTFFAYVSHEQTILKLPQGAVSLAGNNFEPNHLVKFTKTFWGVQFHPEFNAAVSREYWRRNNKTGKCGNTNQNKQANITGSQLLNRFISWALQIN